MPALRHAAFLRRLGDDDLADGRSRRGQGAFLTLRVVDQLAGPWQDNLQAFAYQRSATERYVTELGDQDHPETRHLRRIVKASIAPRTLLVAALREYAEYLAITGSMSEAADVLAALLDVGMGAAPAAEWIEPFQRAVHTLLELGRDDEAAALRRRAKDALRGNTDPAVRLRARVARIEMMVAEGDLATADRAARRCVLDAERSNDLELE